MRKSKRTEIQIETHEVTIIRTRKPPLVFCECCRVEVTPIRPEQAAEVLRIGCGDVLRLITEERIHLIRSHGDAPLICGVSLGRAYEPPISDVV